MRRRDASTSREERGALQVPRSMGLLVAVPVVLALGAATIATFLVGVTALVIAPRVRGRSAWRGHRRRSGHTRPGGHERTITLDPSAYRTRDHAAANERGASTRALPPAPPRRPADR